MLRMAVVLHPLVFFCGDQHVVISITRACGADCGLTQVWRAAPWHAAPWHAPLIAPRTAGSEAWSCCWQVGMLLSGSFARGGLGGGASRGLETQEWSGWWRR